MGDQVHNPADLTCRVQTHWTAGWVRRYAETVTSTRTTRTELCRLLVTVGKTSNLASSCTLQKQVETE